MAELLERPRDRFARSRAASWHREGDEIVRELEFEDFAAAIAFVEPGRRAAEAANHHPDILVHGWNKVRLTLTTHSAGGLTEADFELAAQDRRAALRRSGPSTAAATVRARRSNERRRPTPK